MGMEESGVTCGGQENMNEIEGEDSGVLCYASLLFQHGDRSTDREATTEAADLKKQLGQEDTKHENSFNENGIW